MDIISAFPATLSELRRKNGLSQRKAAEDLKISQALLSHYENGTREPGLSFVCRVCDYYGVTADYLLGRSKEPQFFDRGAELTQKIVTELKELTAQTEAELKELNR